MMKCGKVVRQVMLSLAVVFTACGLGYGAACAKKCGTFGKVGTQYWRLQLSTTTYQCYKSSTLNFSYYPACCQTGVAVECVDLTSVTQGVNKTVDVHICFKICDSGCTDNALPQPMTGTDSLGSTMIVQSVCYDPSQGSK